MRKLCQILVLLLLILSLSAQAEMVKHISSATIPVADRSPQVLQQALAKAFAQVLIKISGNPSVMTLPAIQSETSDTNQYIQSYSYNSTTDASGNEQLVLSVQFDQKALDQLLQNAGQAVWSQNRPLTLVWVKVNDNILSSSIDDAMTSAINHQAVQRGVPVLLPTMDLDDQGFINADATKKFNQDLIQQAAKRYDVSNVLAGRLTQMDNAAWQGDWLMMLNGEPVQWSNQGETAAAVLERAIDQMADLMANRLAVLRNKNLQRQFTVEVMGIGDLSEYATVMKALEKLDPVSSVSVTDMQSNSLLLKVVSTADEQALVGALRQDKHFQQIPASLSVGATQADLYFRWLSADKKPLVEQAQAATTPAAPAASAPAVPVAPQQAQVGSQSNFSAAESQQQQSSSVVARTTTPSSNDPLAPSAHQTDMQHSELPPPGTP